MRRTRTTIDPVKLDDEILVAAKRLFDSGVVPTNERIRAEVHRGMHMIRQRIEYLEEQNRWPYRVRKHRRSARAIAGGGSAGMSSVTPEPKPEPSDSELSLDGLIAKVRRIRAADAERCSQTARAR